MPTVGVSDFLILQQVSCEAQNLDLNQERQTPNLPEKLSLVSCVGFFLHSRLNPNLNPKQTRILKPYFRNLPDYRGYSNSLYEAKPFVQLC